MISPVPGPLGTLTISLESPEDEDDPSVGVQRTRTHSGPSNPLPNFEKVRKNFRLIFNDYRKAATVAKEIIDLNQQNLKYEFHN